MSTFVTWRGGAIKMPETADEVEALVVEAEAELREKAARVVCGLCSLGLRATKGPNGWEHRGVLGRDDSGCNAAEIRELTP